MKTSPFSWLSHSAPPPLLTLPATSLLPPFPSLRLCLQLLMSPVCQDNKWADVCGHISLFPHCVSRYLVHVIRAEPPRTRRCTLSLTLPFWLKKERKSCVSLWPLVIGRKKMPTLSPFRTPLILFRKIWTSVWEADVMGFGWRSVLWNWRLFVTVGKLQDIS